MISLINILSLKVVRMLVAYILRMMVFLQLSLEFVRGIFIHHHRLFMWMIMRLQKNYSSRLLNIRIKIPLTRFVAKANVPIVGWNRMKIIVGSMNPTKTRAVQAVLSADGVTGIEIQSGVASQRFSEAETKQGAVNRGKQSA